MPKIYPISRRNLIKKIMKLGYEGPFSGGKHQFYQRYHHKITVPNPHRKDISPLILKDIARQLGLSSEEFNSL